VRSGDSRRRWLKLAASLAATAPLPLRGQPGRDPGRPLVVVNARVHAAHPAGNGATALAVEAGRISMLGSDAALLGLRPAGARVIDAGGRWLVPGLCDLEADLLSAGLAYTRTLRWDGAGSLPVALARLREHAAGLPAGAWVVVEGASPRVDAWLSGLDDGAIDIAAGGRPVLVVTAPGQGRINPPAARRLGLDPGAGLALSGMAAQAAHAHALGAARDSAERDASVERLGRQYARFGVTTLVDIGEAAYPDDYASLVRLNAAGRLFPRDERRPSRGGRPRAVEFGPLCRTGGSVAATARGPDPRDRSRRHRLGTARVGPCPLGLADRSRRCAGPRRGAAGRRPPA
jgi:predicted amidohydrolase YtcJ